MNERAKKSLEGGNLITGKSFNVSFSTAVEASEMESLVCDIRSFLGIKERSTAVLEIAKLAREKLEDTNRGEEKTQLRMNSDSAARWFTEGIKAVLRILTKRLEVMEKELRSEFEAKSRWYRESVQALNDKIGILQEEKSFWRHTSPSCRRKLPSFRRPILMGRY